MPAEFDFLNWIRAQQASSPLVNLGIGDDLAALNWPNNDLLLIGVDQVLDGVHFDSKIHPPRAIGQKAMNRNLSDCAAMACLPAAAVATVALPKNIGINYAKELYLGMKQAADKFHCPLVGGDTGSWDGKLAMTVTILGRSAGIAPIRRSTANIGDRIYVTGKLGGSIAGRHLVFQPQVNLARQLATTCTITAMIDLSDGFSRDLHQICQDSGVGAIVNANHLPLHQDIQKIQRPDWQPVHHALHDGEDYELLFTSPRCTHPAATDVGQIVPEKSIRLSTGELLNPLGWEHQL